MKFSSVTDVQNKLSEFVDTLAGENLTAFTEDTPQHERQDIAAGLLTYYVCVCVR